MPVHTLLLKTSDISTDNSSLNYYPSTVVVSSNVGSLSNCRTIANFNKIDFKTLLGADYDKHDIFNLQVTQFMTTPTDASGQVCNGYSFVQNLDVLMRGLDWVTSGYNVSSKNNNAFACAGNVNLTTLLCNTPVSRVLDEYVIQFRKQPVASLEVSLNLNSPLEYNTTRIPSYFFSSANAVFYHWGLMCKIYPASEYTGNILSF